MIEVTGLQKRFEGGSAICYEDLRFETGKSYVLLGASGCGKSTLLNMISGILTPSEGHVVIDGVEMSGQSQPKKDAFRVAHIGCVFQDFKLIEEMTVADNIEILRLEHVDIAKGLLILCVVIIADEPTGSLNYAIGRRIMEELIEAARGKTLICVTHDDRLAELFDVVIDMNDIASSTEEEGEAHA